MGKRYIGILIVVLGLLVAGLFVYFSFFYKPSQETPTPEQTAINQGPTTDKGTTQNITNPEIEQPKTVINATSQTVVNREQVTQDDLKRMAGSFAERFGSYSNQSDYGNIRDLELFMSASMKVWADNYISDSITKRSSTDIYYGITTRAVSKNVESFDDDAGTAKVLVKTQRRESTGTSANATNFYQDILISFVRERDVWKVNSAYWQTKQ